MASISLLYCTSLVLLLVFGFFALNTDSRTLEDASLRERHEQWMAEHGKVYKDSYEKELRYKIFKENVQRIEAFNNARNKSYKLGINQFTDITNEEFKGRNGFKGYVPSTVTKTSTFKYADVAEVPTSVDWRAEGAVTGVKYQGQCGCCWAFSAVAATEGLTKLRTGELISLSEQELVDCDTNNGGCGGGTMVKAFEFIIQNQGLASETNYPYQGFGGTCKANNGANNAAKITGYEVVPANSESALLNAAANQPISVAIEGSGFEFQHYSSDVFTGSCGTKLDHAVTVVGYGVTDDGTKYWLIKNSWGTSWGEQGYMRMLRDIDANEGLCGVAMHASYPTL